MYPDILNYDRVVSVTGSFKTPMGCRSFLGVWEENGEQVHDGRNNLGVISLNLPRIALEARGDEARFWQLLDERLELAKSVDDAHCPSGAYQSARGTDSLYGRRLRRAAQGG